MVEFYTTVLITGTRPVDGAPGVLALVPAGGSQNENFNDRVCAIQLSRSTRCRAASIATRQSQERGRLAGTQPRSAQRLSLLAMGRSEPSRRAKAILCGVAVDQPAVVGEIRRTCTRWSNSCWRASASRR